MLKKIDHIGIAVKSINAARPFYEEILGFKFEKIEIIESQKVKTAFFKIGDIHIELLEPTAPDSTVAVFLKKRGEGFHHIAYESDDLNEQLDQATAKGVKLIQEKPIIGAGGKEIIFLHPKSSFGVLTELCNNKVTAAHSAPDLSAISPA